MGLLRDGFNEVINYVDDLNENMVVVLNFQKNGREYFSQENRKFENFIDIKIKNGRRNYENVIHE